MKSTRTKALEISQKVKQVVFKRDNGRCVLCGKEGLPEAHYISRAKGGLGIEQNIVCLCRMCHFKLDSTTQRKELLEEVKDYLEMHYPKFNDEKRRYKKGGLPTN